MWSLIFIYLLSIANCINCTYLTIPELGTIKGSISFTTWTNRTIFQFLGIPYAEAPINDLRFQPPKRKPPFTSVFDATKFGQSCPTSASVKTLAPKDYKKSEDCLSLSVFSTNLNRNANRAVMFLIFGSGFEVGTSNIFTGNYLLEGDIVLVTCNYRMGPLGFLSTDSPTIPGNAGFLDAVLALKWVKKHIRYFGGNPNKITIMGGSSGAAMVSAMVLSSDTVVPHNLFHAAIMSSGSYFCPWAFDTSPIETAKELFKFVDKTKCRNPENMNMCFKQLDIASLWKAEDQFEAQFIQYGHNPRLSYGKTVFPVKPNNFLNGENVIPMRNIPLMTGVNKEDGLVYIVDEYNKLLAESNIRNTNKFNTFDLLNYAANLFGIKDSTGTFNAFLIKSLLNQYQIAHGNINDILPAYKDLGCDVQFKGPVLKAAQAHAKYYPDKTYLYTFDYRGQYSLTYNLSMNSPFYNGVQHGDESFYLFPLVPLNNIDTQIAKLMVDLWTSFAKYGVPSSRYVKEWLPLTRYTGPYLHINRTSEMGEDFLDEFSVISRQAREKSIRNWLSMYFNYDDLYLD